MIRLSSFFIVLLVSVVHQMAFAQNHVPSFGVLGFGSHHGHHGDHGGGPSGWQNGCETSFQDVRNFCVNSTRSYQEESSCIRDEMTKQPEYCAPVASQILDRCQKITQTWEQESLCYRGRIDQGSSYMWNVMDSFRCTGHNVFGSYAQGGNCNAFGCYQPGGSCGAMGCVHGEGGSFSCVN